MIMNFFSVSHNTEMQSYVLECGDDVIILTATTLDDAIGEAEEIVAEWA